MKRAGYAFTGGLACLSISSASAAIVDIQCGANRFNGRGPIAIHKVLPVTNGVMQFSRSGKNNDGRSYAEDWRVEVQDRSLLNMKATGNAGGINYSYLLGGSADPVGRRLTFEGSQLSAREAVSRDCTAKVVLDKPLPKATAERANPAVTNAAPTKPYADTKQANVRSSSLPEAQTPQHASTTAAKALVPAVETQIAPPDAMAISPRSPAPNPQQMGQTAQVAPPDTQKNVTPHSSPAPKLEVQPSSPSATAASPDALTALSKSVGDMNIQINKLTIVIAEQKASLAKAPEDAQPRIKVILAEAERQLEQLRKQYTEDESRLNNYLTNVRPADRELYLSARKMSELYPPVPWYIPGSPEVGEFWIEPRVSDRGEMVFSFTFVDGRALVSKVRSKIDMSLSEIEATRDAFLKLYDWSAIAHEQKLRRNYEKRVVCFPVAECPPDGERLDGKSSTEIRFAVYEDGSTAGKVQRNKGKFAENYNVSIESGLLLSAYLSNVIAEAKAEYLSGSQDKSALDAMFK